MGSTVFQGWIDRAFLLGLGTLHLHCRFTFLCSALENN